MKKIVLSALIAGNVAFAAGYGSAGCGLGSVIFGEKPGAMQILASTTNSSSGNQTFGMSSGTLNCGSSPLASNDSELYKFMQQNIDAVAMDISIGQGEYLNTLATYLKVDSIKLGATLKANFNKIYTNDNIKVKEIMNNINAVINS